jgi:ribose 5-phosphate isomerase RpiB
MADTFANSVIYMGSDHAGYDLKIELAEYLRGQGKKVVDLGCHSKERVRSTIVTNIFHLT